MKKLLFTSFLCALVFAANAQDDNNKAAGLAVGVGAQVNYYYGPGDQNFGKFENERVNWQANFMLGIVIAGDKSHRTMLAGFGSLGFNNDKTMKHIFEDQKYVTTSVDQDQSNSFYQLEGGLVIADILRVSTGIGQQNFLTQTIADENGISFNTKSLKYNSSTVSLNYKVSLVSFSIGCNFNYGKEYHRTVLNPSAGLMFNL